MGMWRTAQRTMILALGPQAHGIAGRVQERLERRHGGLPVVVVVPVEIGEGSPGDERLAEAWLSISQADHRQALTEREFRLETADEVALYLLADLHGAQAFPAVAALARQAQAVAQHVLRVPALSTGFLLLPATSNGEAHEPEEPVVEGLLSWDGELAQIFPGGCYLLSRMNSQGLILAEAAWRERIAEGLYLLLTSPLRRLLGEMDPVGMWPGRGDTARFGSFGLAWLASPAGDMVNRFARRWQREAIELLLSPWPQEAETARTARRELAQSPWTPPRLDEEELRPAEVQRRLALPIDSYTHPHPLHLSDWRGVLDEVHSERARVLAHVRTPLLQSLAQALDVWQEVAKEQITAWLDDEPVGALERATAGLAAWEETLAAWREGVEARNEEHREALAEIETERTRRAEQLDGLLALFPRPTLAGLWSVLWRPARWLRLLAAYRQVNEQTRRYLAVLESDLQSRINLAVGETLARFYATAVQHTVGQRERLAALRQVLQNVCSAPPAAGSEGEQEAEDEGDAELWAPLYDELYEEMMGDGIAALRACLREHGPLSRWLDERADVGRDGVTPPVLSRALEAHARRWLGELAQWPAEMFLAQRYSDDEQRRTWFADFLAEAAPLCRFDLAGLTDEERGEVAAVRVLALAPDRAEGEPNPLAACLRRHPERITVMHREMQQPLVAFTAVRNLPWPALQAEKRDEAGR